MARPNTTPKTPRYITGRAARLMSAPQIGPQGHIGLLHAHLKQTWHPRGGPRPPTRAAAAADPPEQPLIGALQRLVQSATEREPTQRDAREGEQVVVVDLDQLEAISRHDEVLDAERVLVGRSHLWGSTAVGVDERVVAERLHEGRPTAGREHASNLGERARKLQVVQHPDPHTTSKEWSGRSSASAFMHLEAARSDTPRAAALDSAAAMATGELSIPVTATPLAARSNAALRVPHPYSKTFASVPIWASSDR